jgi:hypothetical protein
MYFPTHLIQILIVLLLSHGLIQSRPFLCAKPFNYFQFEDSIMSVAWRGEEVFETCFKLLPRFRDERHHRVEGQSRSELDEQYRR